MAQMPSVRFSPRLRSEKRGPPGRELRGFLSAAFPERGRQHVRTIDHYGIKKTTAVPNLLHMAEQERLPTEILSPLPCPAHQHDTDSSDPPRPEPVSTCIRRLYRSSGAAKSHIDW